MKSRTNYKAFQGYKTPKNVKDDSVNIEKDPSLAEIVKENEKTKNIIGKTTSKVYLRKGPSKNEDDITILSEGDEISIISGIDDNTDWYKVCTPFGREGYIMKEFIEIRNV